MFDVEKLADFVQDAIRNFAMLHQEETFYAFCITGSLLSLNSEEAFAQKLAYYQRKYPENYKEDNRIQGLKANSGDWQYQGFAEFTQENGFDDAGHEHHYNLHLPLPEGETIATEYGAAMEELMQLLRQRNAFGPLRRTDDFSISREDYD